jgi:serine/threonine protein phosphatase PrpC
MSYNLLSIPSTKKVGEDGYRHVIGEFVLQYGVSSMQNWRTYQEDAFAVNYYAEKEIYIFSIFDGHGSAETSNYCRNYFNSFLHQKISLASKITQDLLQQAFLDFDKELFLSRVKTNSNVSSGSTATVVIVNCKSKQVHVAHLGDSRVLVFQNQNLLYASRDHNPENETETKRLKHAMFINEDCTDTEDEDSDKMNGFSLIRDRIYASSADVSLNVCRGFGDFIFKQFDEKSGLDCATSAVISQPECFQCSFSQDESSLSIYLASDGIWNSNFPSGCETKSVGMNDQIIAWSNKVLNTSKYSTKISESFDLLSAKPPITPSNVKQTDNMTAMLITIRKEKSTDFARSKKRKFIQLNRKSSK